MKAKNSIEINGKVYDAHTGHLLFDKRQSSTSDTKHPVAAHHPQSRGHSIDGVHPSRGSHTKKSVTTHHQPTTSTHHRTPNTFKRRVHHSTTLHRGAVQPPQLILTASEESAESTTPPIIQKVDPKRLKRAQHITKSSVISRFNNSVVSKPSTIHKKSVADPHDTPVTHEPSTEPIAAKSPAATHVHKAVVAAQSAHKSHSTHHTHKTHSRSKLFSYGASSLVVLLLAGYVAYLNIPSLSMKVAASRAGFAATIPNSRPAGYSLSGPVQASPGQVTINFGSNTDDRRFTLKQQPTTWDSQALLENYVTTKDKNYFTYQDRGLTVYVFNGSDAAWVNAGKFYTVEGKNAELDTDQILNLATSM